MFPRILERRRDDAFDAAPRFNSSCVAISSAVPFSKSASPQYAPSCFHERRRNQYRSSPILSGVDEHRTPHGTRVDVEIKPRAASQENIFGVGSTARADRQRLRRDGIEIFGDIPSHHRVNHAFAQKLSRPNQVFEFEFNIVRRT